jgi:eukaryotic-like serine/threonine-protein kinase
VDVALGLIADRYELGDIVGQGRSAVYRARDTRLGRAVALKRVLVAPDVGDPVSSSESPEDVRTRALREARATARVASAHAVGVYDLVEEGDAVWLVMELVDAPCLERLVADGGPLDEARAARIGLAVLDALAAAHAEGIVHRDVKPANVLVGEPTKLADFGIAALRDESGLTQPGMIVGSPAYMAPEQASAGNVGPEADLWALGALLYFAVEGAPPFAAGSALATAAAVVHSPVRPQRRPGRLSPVIARLLAKDPAARPGPADVRRLLAPVAAGAATVADTTQISRDVAPAPGGGPSTLVAPAVTPPSGSGRRRPRRLALAAVLAVVAAGVAAAAGIALAGGDRDTPPARARPPAAVATTLAPAVTTTAPSPRRPQGKAKGKAKHQAPASGDQRVQAAAAPTTAATTAPTAPPTTESAPQDSVVTTPPTTEPPTTAPPTTVGTGGAAADPPPDPA